MKAESKPEDIDHIKAYIRDRNEALRSLARITIPDESLAEEIIKSLPRGGKQK
jgi:hypothetical protein